MPSMRSKINILLVEIIDRNLGRHCYCRKCILFITAHTPRSSRERYVIHHYNIASEDSAMLSAADLIIFDGGGVQ